MDTVVRRKTHRINSKSINDLYKDTLFHKRFQDRLTRGLKDVRKAAEFYLNDNLRYSDDPNEEIYEIKEIDNVKYFVFTFSLVHIALPVDEALFFDPIRIQFIVFETTLDGQSRFNNANLSIVINFGAMLVFFVVLYMIFPALRNTVFALCTKRKGHK